MDTKIYNLILDVRDNEQIASFDEATTKQAIILRILSELGWNIFNTNEVKPEYSVGGRRVDYSLRLNNVNKVFLEVKKCNEDLENHQQQLLDYSFQEGIRLAVLTNGISWWFYLPLNEGNWEQRKFFAIDITQQQPEDTSKRFVEFLSKDNVTSESAVKVAETLLKGRVRETEIRQNLPKAWNKILSGPDELLVELINETLEKICGHKAETEQIVNFIKKHINAPSPVVERAIHKQIEPAVRPPHTAIMNRGNRSKTMMPRSLPQDDTLCRFTYKGIQYNGVIKNGSLSVEKIGSFTSFSGASVEISKTSRNGWTDWEVKLPGTNQWLLAATWRKKQKNN